MKTGTVYGFGPFRQDTTARTLARNGSPVALTPKAFDVLAYLVSHAGSTVTRDEIIHAVWPDTFVEEGNLNFNISQIRKALGEGEPGVPYIQTLPKQGYRFIAQVSQFDGQSKTGSIPAARIRTLNWTLSVVLGLALVTLAVALWRVTRPTLKPLVRLDIDLGSDVALGSSLGADVIISPDGTMLAYVSRGRLFTRSLDQPSGRELPGTVGATSPFFSPDGRWIGFFADGKLKKIGVDGGSAINLCDAAIGRGGSWSEDGYIIAALGSNSGLSRIPSAGGSPTPVTELDRLHGDLTHRWPQTLPGGKAVLFTAAAAAGYDGANIDLVSLGDHQRKTVVHGGAFGRYVASGYLIYVHQGTLFAVHFDLNRLETRGSPSPILDQVAYNPGSGFARMDVSRSGTLVYRGGAAGELVTVQWLDRAGNVEPLLSKPGQYLYPRLSPDGRRLAIASAEGATQDLWVYHWQHGAMTRLTFGNGYPTNPVWTPDGRYIIFQATGGMFWTPADGSGKPRPLTHSENLQMPYSWTADGRRLAFMEVASAGGYNLWTVPIVGESASLQAGKPERISSAGVDERHPAFSPDGRWLAYTSNESGAFQVYVRAFPDKGGKWQVSHDGGMYPAWSRSGRQLFFRTKDDRIMVVPYTSDSDSFIEADPRLRSEKQLANVGQFGSYDVAPDGDRVAALWPAQNLVSRVIFLENFSDELRRRLP